MAASIHMAADLMMLCSIDQSRFDGEEIHVAFYYDDDDGHHVDRLGDGRYGRNDCLWCYEYHRIY